MTYQPPQSQPFGDLPFSLSTIPDILNGWADNFKRNTHTAFSRLTLKDYIRLTIILCGYMLIVRPLLLKMGARAQAAQHEKANKEAEELARSDAAISANHLRGKVAIPGVDSDSDDEDGIKGDVKTGEWGRKARVRQRKLVRKALEAKEKGVGINDDSDDDIKEFLMD